MDADAIAKQEEAVMKNIDLDAIRKLAEGGVEGPAPTQGGDFTITAADELLLAQLDSDYEEEVIDMDAVQSPQREVTEEDLDKLLQEEEAREAKVQAAKLARKEAEAKAAADKKKKPKKKSAKQLKKEKKAAEAEAKAQAAATQAQQLAQDTPPALDPNAKSKSKKDLTKALQQGSPNETAESQQRSLESLQQELKALQRKAVSQKRAGDRDGAIETMRTIKVLKAHIEMRQHGSDGSERAQVDVLLAVERSLTLSNKAMARARPQKQLVSALSSGAGSTATMKGLTPENKTIRRMLLERRDEYKRAAIVAKRAKDSKRQLQLLRVLKGMQELLKRVQKNDQSLRQSDVPPPLDQQEEDEVAAEPAPASDAGAGAGNGGKDNPHAAKFQELLSRMNEQAASMARHAKRAFANKDENPGATRTAAAYLKYKKQTDADIARLKQQLAAGSRLPMFTIETIEVGQLVLNPDVDDKTVEIFLAGARGLRSPSVSKSGDLCTYAQWSIPFPSEKKPTKGQTSTIKKSDAPQWKEQIKLTLPNRSAKVARAFKYLRMKIEVFHTRSLRKDVSVGVAEIRLGDLITKSHLETERKLTGSESGVGAVSVRVRMRLPLDPKAAHIEQAQHKIVVLGENRLAIGSKAKAKTHARKASNQLKVEAASGHARKRSGGHARKPSGAKRAIPAGLTAQDVAHYDHASMMVSNEVLEAELTDCEKQIAAEQAAGRAPMDLVQRQITLQAQIAILVDRVQSGKLSLDDYLAGLKTAIEKNVKIAQYLKSGGEKAGVVRVLRRVKIMKKELAEAEANRGELE